MVFCRGCFVPFNGTMYIYQGSGYCGDCMLKRLASDGIIEMIENEGKFGYVYHDKGYTKEQMLKIAAEEICIGTEEV